MSLWNSICLSGLFIRQQSCFIMTHRMMLLWCCNIWRWHLVCWRVLMWWVLLWWVLLWWVLIWCCLLVVTCMCNGHAWRCTMTRLLGNNCSMTILNKVSAIDQFVARVSSSITNTRKIGLPFSYEFPVPVQMPWRSFWSCKMTN